MDVLHRSRPPLQSLGRTRSTGVGGRIDSEVARALLVMVPVRRYHEGSWLECHLRKQG